jgi:hypothetical protein
MSTITHHFIRLDDSENRKKSSKNKGKNKKKIIKKNKKKSQNADENVVTNTDENVVTNADENINEISTQNKNEIDHLTEQKECSFCFDNVDIDKSFIGCNTCGNYCHDKCYIDWFRRGHDKVCISCKQGTLVYAETNITLIAQCLSFIWKKKPTYSKKYYYIG